MSKLKVQTLISNNTLFENILIQWHTQSRHIKLFKISLDTDFMFFFTTLNKGIRIKIMNLELMSLLTDAFYKTL